MKNFSRHLYLILLAMSCTAMTVAGLCALQGSGETYGGQPALAATAINQIKQYLSEPEDEGADLEEIVRSAYATGEHQPDILSRAKKEDLKTDEARREKLELEKESRKPASDTGKKHKKKKNSSKKKKDKDNSSGTAWRTVGENYFTDALFIGDSRQQGFGLYSQLEGITVYAQKGYQIVSATKKPVAETPFGKITLTDALAVYQHRFGKVYIMFGLNELTGGDRDLSSYYYNLIDYIKMTQPGAVIYLESIIHVSESAARKQPSLANDKIDHQNEILREIAKNENIVFLDLNEIFTDQNGALFSDAASDGIHLKSEYILKLRNYLMTHAAAAPRASDEFADYIDLTPEQQLLKDQIDEYEASLNNTPAADQ